MCNTQKELKPYLQGKYRVGANTKKEGSLNMDTSLALLAVMEFQRVSPISLEKEVQVCRECYWNKEEQSFFSEHLGTKISTVYASYDTLAQSNDHMNIIIREISPQRILHYDLSTLGTSGT